MTLLTSGYRAGLTSPYMEWDEFTRTFRWNQGDHLTALGATRSGKTTLLLELIERHRAAVVALATKRRDPQLDALIKRKGRDKWHRIDSWDRMMSERPRVLLRPRLTSLTDRNQRYVFKQALDSIFATGYYCVFADELRYLTQQLGLRQEWEVLLMQGRTLKITVVTAAQRPAWVPLECYSQATWIIFWRTTDRRDIDRISDITGSVDRDLIRHDIRRLRPHEALVVNRDTGQVFRILMPADVARQRER